MHLLKKPSFQRVPKVDGFCSGATVVAKRWPAPDSIAWDLVIKPVNLQLLTEKNTWFWNKQAGNSKPQGGLQIRI